MNLCADLLFKLILCIYKILDIKRAGSIFAAIKPIIKFLFYIIHVMNTKRIIIQECDFLGQQ